MKAVKKVTVPFFISHHGCPHTCIFCDQKIISGSSGNLPTTEEIMYKVEKWRQTAAGRPLEAAFFGGTFTALPEAVQERLLASLKPALSSGVVSSIRISTRPDYITKETVLRLAGNGVTTIELGVQSMDDAVLETAHRGHTAADSYFAIDCIRSCGVVAGAQLMPGLPGDTTEKSLHSLQEVIKTGADFIRLYPVVVFQGTALAAKYHQGDYHPLTVDNGVAICKILLKTALRDGVDVIRIGLQAGDGINDDTVVAGCWHPALGQLVHSELYFDLLVQSAVGLSKHQKLTVKCHPDCVSDLLGHGRRNITRLLELGVQIEHVLQDKTIAKHDVVVEGVNHSFNGNIMETGISVSSH